MQNKHFSQQSQQRNRKDPQRRNFQCKCGRTYLSFPALYTHIKIKHNNSDQYQKAIKRPYKQKHLNGRPKKRKRTPMSIETRILSICEQTTLMIYDKLKSCKKQFFKNPFLILEGNSELSIEQYEKQKQRLMNITFGNCSYLKNENRSYSNDKNKGEDQNTALLKLDFFLDEYSPNKHAQFLGQNQFYVFKRYIKGVNKHFVGEIAAKVTYCVGFILQQNLENIDKFIKNIDTLNHLNVWLNKELLVYQKPLLFSNQSVLIQQQINQILIDSIGRWFQALKKTQIKDDNGQQISQKEEVRSEQIQLSYQFSDKNNPHRKQLLNVTKQLLSCATKES